MKVAIVTRDLPLPPGTGLNLVIHNLVRGLAERHDVRFFILQRGYYNYKVPGNANDPALFPWPFEECPAQPISTSTRALSRSTRYYGIQTSKIDWLSERLNAFGAERVVGFDFNLAPYVALLPNRVPKILDAVDSEILYYRNQLAAGNFKTGVVKHLAAAWMMGREHISRFSAVVTVSDADSRNIARATGARKVETVPNGVDHEFFAPNPAIPRLPAQVVFCGSLSFPPNQQAIVWFVEKCWDGIKAAQPDAKLLVIGKSPSADLKPRLEAHAGVECLGYVDDIRTHILESSVSIAPMISGSGIKNKILEAWALGVPVVATPLAVRGLNHDAGQNILIGATPAELTRHCLAIMRDASLRERIGAAGRAYVVENYTWHRSRERFNAIVEQA
jgi:polysaccharide biosynthesis protein PslH